MDTTIDWSSHQNSRPASSKLQSSILDTLLGSLYSPSEWIFLIGGGPSLRGFDWEKLADRRCIAINAAGYSVPWADVLFFTDWRFYEAHRRLVDGFSGITVTDDRNTEASVDVLVQHTGSDDLDTEWPGIRHGDNSGYAAINLAWHFGARRLALLGYDMCSSADGRMNFHGHYARHGNPAKVKSWVPHFERLDPDRYGLEIVNCSPESALTCFPKRSVDEVLWE